MKKFKNVYQNYYNKINLNKEKKEEIFNNIVNNNQKYKKIYYRQKLITITCSILIICLISTGIVFAKDIVKNIYKIEKKNNQTNCLMQNIINNKVNTNINWQKNEIITKDELEKNLGINILSNEYFDYEYKISNIINENGLEYMQVDSNIIKAKDLYEDAFDDISTFKLSFSLLTSKSSKKTIAKFKNDTIIFNCKEQKFETLFIDSLNIEAYYLPLINTTSFSGYNFDNLDFVFFYYDDVLYKLEASYVNKDMIVHFINTLNYK